MSKIGKHEAVLEKIMSETNYDFFYFNKLKYQQEKEGKWNFAAPNLNPFSFLNTGKDRNRVKKAFNSTFTIIAVQDNPGTSVNTKDVDLDTSDLPCLWRGKDAKGEALKCTNKRMEHPHRKVNHRPEILSFCCYHATECFSDSHSPNDPSVKIGIPNKLAYCVECYTLKVKKRIPPLTLQSAPGVVPVVVMSSLALLQSKTTEQRQERDAALRDGNKKTAATGTSPTPKKKKKATTCQWKPNNNNEKLRLWMCTNPFHVDSAGKVYETCLWHMTACMRAHEPNTNSSVAIPNMFGLCAMHYLAEQGKPLVATPFPYPGLDSLAAVTV
jgi:hypothetical protein